MSKFTRILALVLCMLMLMGTVSECLASVTAKVISSSMNVYSRANSSSKYKVGTLKKGKTFKVVSYSGDWAKISLSGKKGYAKIGSMMFSSGKTMYTNCNTGVYRSASTSSKIGTLSVNTKVSVVGWSGSYYLIKSGSKTGYISKSHLSGSYTATTMYLNSNATVYGSASTSSPKATFLKGTKVKMSGTSGDFAKITVSGKSCYIKKSALSKSSSSVSKKTLYANKTASVYNLSSGSGKLATLKQNQKVTAVGTSGSYYAIANGSRVGFVAKSALSSQKTAAASVSKSSSSSKSGASLMPASLRSTQASYNKNMSSSQKIEHVIYYAQGKLGCKYSSHPNNSTTFDCLTLVYHAFKASGKQVGDTPKGCASMSCTSVKSTGDLKRGDLVCFDTSEKGYCNHVGIYVGSGYFIHASSTGGKVILSSLTSGFYKRTFLGAKRIF